MIDDNDSEWLDGLLFGWFMFDNSKGMGFILSIVVLAIIIGCLYYF